ncbi:MAG TPA: hypothetical protein VIQ30_21615 [Pseudonocardia sp.]|jgi:hypothetical protein
MYRIVTDGVIPHQIAALPGVALAGYAQTLAVLELVAWNGDPINADNPAGNVRVLPFGDVGMVIYLILEDQQRVDVVEVIWGS